MSSPGMTLRKPGQRRPPTEVECAALENMAEGIATKIPGEDVAVQLVTPQSEPTPPPVSMPTSRNGSILAPRRRRDGTPTVSTTVTLPVELANWLKVYHATNCPQRHQSDIICDALVRYRQAAETNSL